MSAWIDQIFDADQAKNNGVVRRARSSVDKDGGGIAALRAEVVARGFHLVETGDQCVILCHPGELKVHC
jgi:hypothetical protein